VERVNGRDPKEKLIEDLLNASKKKWYEKPFGIILLSVVSAIVTVFLIHIFGLS